MGCPCFGRKKKVVRRLTNENLQVDHQFSSPDHDAIPSDKSPDEMNVRMLEPTPDFPKPTDNPCAKSNAVIFSYRELATSTNNFRQESIIGEGGFGVVYKGQLERTGEIVAVKQLNHSGLQGNKEFLVEVLMLSLLRHRNLVNFIGYCAEGEQRLLVYEYMPLGSLEYHLHDLTPDMPPLDWNTRMKIAAGAANGLNFLHNEANPPVIYRDLKSSNILLDKGFFPRFSDFGLAKFGPGDDRSHVSTRVMGTHGYCAPEYAGTGKLTMKSDIYSFGVLLLELITGLRALDTTRGHGKHVLVDLVRPILRDCKNYAPLADPRLNGQFSESLLRKAIEIAIMCVRENPQSRPNITEVVNALNYLASLENENEPGDAVANLLERRNKVVKMNKKNSDRERAVAEAKMWGETWRGKRNQCDDDLTR